MGSTGGCAEAVDSASAVPEGGAVDAVAPALDGADVGLWDCPVHPVSPIRLIIAAAVSDKAFMLFPQFVGQESRSPWTGYRVRVRRMMLVFGKAREKRTNQSRWTLTGPPFL